MSKLKSVHLVSYGSNVTGERVYHKASQAIFALTYSGILDGLGIIPCFYNGERVKSRAALVRALKLETGKRTTVKIQWCSNESQGFERCVSVQTFKSCAAFERSIYCRRYGFYTSNQVEQIENLIK